jgi:hypothetical protein
VRRAGFALVLGLITVLFVFARPGWSQTEDGATMTVLRGEVAVLRSNGTAVQPAVSGTVIFGGDEIRTLTSAGALVTFQVGTEIELGNDTIVTIERVSRQGERIDVSVKQVQGASLHRVASFNTPGSAYRVDAGGAVVQVRGTEFLVYGPQPSGAVIVVCRADCDGRTTFSGQALSANTGYYAVVENGRVVLGPEAFKPDLSGGLWGAASEAGTMVEQALQDEAGAPPPGQNPAGQRTTGQNESHDSKDQKAKGPSANESAPTQTVTPPPGSTATFTPIPPPGSTATFTPTPTPPPGATATFTPTPSLTPSPTFTATVTNTPVPPALAINDVSALEGDATPHDMVFTVTRSGVTTAASSVNYATADGSALAGVNYTAVSGTLIFPPGSTSQNISVPILGDNVAGSDTTFVVNLSSPISATIADAQGVGTIVNDDGAP